MISLKIFERYSIEDIKNEILYTKKPDVVLRSNTLSKSKTPISWSHAREYFITFSSRESHTLLKVLSFVLQEFHM